MKKTKFKSLIPINVRLEGFKVFREKIGTFFNAKVSLVRTKKAFLTKAGIDDRQLKQNIILLDNGCTMYVTVGDVDEQAVPAVIKISRRNLPFVKMERKFAGSMSSLLTSYFTKFKRARDFERLIPILVQSFQSSVIAHQLRVNNYSIELSLNLLSDFQRIILRDYEGEPVSTGVILTRNFYYLKQNVEKLGIILTPIEKLSFKGSFLQIKRGLMLVDGKNSLFVINKQRRIYAVITQKPGFEDDIGENQYVPQPQWLYRVLRGRDWAILTTKNREIELICRGLLKLRYKNGLWSTIPLASFFDSFKAYLSDSKCAQKLLCLIEHLSVSRKGALFVIVDNSRILKDLIEDKKDAVNATLEGTLNLQTSPTEIIKNISVIDGAVILSKDGEILASGAHVHPHPSVTGKPIEGTRTAAALSASYLGYTIKVSHDGDVTAYSKGKIKFHIQ